jgi:uncharacterized protein
MTGAQVAPPMGLLDWVIPQDKVFFDLMDRQAALALDATRQFRAMLDGWQNLEAERNKLKNLEEAADHVAHDIFERLNQTFITPIDREDLARLVHVLDDVVDAIDAAANRLHLYEVDRPTPEMHEFTVLIEGQVTHIQACLVALRKRKSIAKEVPPHLVEIHRLENKADAILNHSVAGLFKTHDPVQILKYKEVYEFLEAATDRCEDVADVFSDVVRKHS